MRGLRFSDTVLLLVVSQIGQIVDPKNMGSKALHDAAEFRSSTTGSNQRMINDSSPLYPSQVRSISR